MTDTATMTLDPYKQEHKVRIDVKNAVAGHGFDVESYGMVDKKTKEGPTRTLTIGLEEMLDENRPAMLLDLKATLAEWGYELDSVKITVKAAKPTSDQLTIPLGEPDDTQP